MFTIPLAVLILTALWLRPVVYILFKVTGDLDKLYYFFSLILMADFNNLC